MDDDDSGFLDIVEFGKAMRECNICDLSKKCIDHLFNYFDKDRSGLLCTASDFIFIDVCLAQIISAVLSWYRHNGLLMVLYFAPTDKSPDYLLLLSLAFF